MTFVWCMLIYEFDNREKDLKKYTVYKL